MSNIFPYLEIKGTHKEIGTAIGKTFKEKIQEIIEDRIHTIPHYETLKKDISPYLALTQKTFPSLIDELEGMADGAGIAFDDLFFHNTREIYDHMRPDDREYEQTEDHCTIAVGFNADTAVIGHNEDWAPENIDELFVLKATIADTTFLGLQYASYICGSSAMLNNWGIAQCINELHQLTTTGIPKYFLSRAICECKTLDEAALLVKNVQRASGFNHVLVQDRTVCDIEIAYGEIDIEKKVNIPYVHTNHCISKKLKKYEHDDRTHHLNSYTRYMRAKELLHDPMTATDMIALLSDTTNPLYPICRSDATIGSVIIEPSLRTMRICKGPPNKGEFSEYRL